VITLNFYDTTVQLNKFIATGGVPDRKVILIHLISPFIDTEFPAFSRQLVIKI